MTVNLDYFVVIVQHVMALTKAIEPLIIGRVGLKAFGFREELQGLLHLSGVGQDIGFGEQA